MRVYTVENKQTALKLAQLIKLNSECARLHWSRSISDTPANVMEALETIEAYVESEVERCATCEIGLLPEAEENAMLTLLKQNSILRASLGSGIVMAGNQAGEVLRALNSEGGFDLIKTALKTGNSVVIF